MEITSIFGARSGFDSASVVQKLIALQSRPIDLKLAQIEAKETELEAFQNLRTQLQTFQSVLSGLNTFDQFNGLTAQFTKTGGVGNVLNISTTSSAAVGTHDIIVNSLAQETTLLSNTGYNATTDVVPLGALGNAFVEVIVGGAITQVAIADNATVQDVVDAINGSVADVTASIINDGSPVNPLKIQIQGNQSGTANAVTARVFRDLVLFEVDDVTFATTQAATDASLIVDGTTYTRATNSISDIIAGVTLNLESLGTGTLNIFTDRTTIIENVKDFVDGFNALIAFIDEQTAFNPETFTSGTLFGNSSVQGLETTLRRIATGQVTGLAGPFDFLSQVGITTQDDGTLTLDEAKLDQALTTDLTNVIELFTSANGVVTQLDSNLSVLLDSSQQGPLKAELDALTASIDDLNETVLRMDERLELFERNIRQEFINLEIILGKLDAQRTAFQQASQNLGSFFNRQI